MPFTHPDGRSIPEYLSRTTSTIAPSTNSCPKSTIASTTAASLTKEEEQALQQEHNISLQRKFEEDTLEPSCPNTHQWAGTQAGAVECGRDSMIRKDAVKTDKPENKMPAIRLEDTSTASPSTRASTRADPSTQSTQATQTGGLKSESDQTRGSEGSAHMVTVESQPTKSDQGKQSVPETATTEGTKIDESPVAHDGEKSPSIPVLGFEPPKDDSFLLE